VSCDLSRQFLDNVNSFKNTTAQLEQNVKLPTNHLDTEIEASRLRTWGDRKEKQQKQQQLQQQTKT